MDLIQEQHFVAYSPKQEAIFSVKGASKIKSNTSSKTAEEQLPPSQAIEYDQNKSTTVAWWGANNDFPTKIDREIELNPTLAGAILKKIEYLYAGGIEYGKEQIVDNQRVWIPMIDPIIDTFINSVHTNAYLAQSLFDYVRYANVFPELVFTLDKSKVAFLTEQQAFHCRWQKQNPSTGFVDYAFINRNWNLGRDENSDDTITLPVIDPIVDTADFIRTENIFRYIFKSPIPSSKTDYAIINWWTAKTSGWLDVSNYIPRFKKSLMERQMSVTKHIEIDLKWLEEKYGNVWLKSTPEEKNEIFKLEIAHFNEMMLGPDKAGGNIMTSKFWDTDINQWISTFIIHDLSKDSKSGEYIEDSNEADAKIHYAVGLDMTMSNTKGGGGMGGGSGSDKREAFNMEQSTNSIHVSVILAPLYWIMNYNRLNPNGDIKLRMRSPQLQTLNQVTPAKRETTLQQ